jgi:hypothetical protein
MSSELGNDRDGKNGPRLPASRLRKRVEAPRPRQALTPDEVLDAGQPLTSDQAPEPTIQPRGSMFAPRSFAGGRVQVFGCAPGFLLISLIASILLTILLNALL